ncbi:hypothetical protein GPECTOR_4g583 [Gonium pectorale]|uniref:Sm domain-containing protein n=1 Tax=Gonium pectorale TaxID=33097 RepID=A0A150GXV5_GONPE|nr:hypothetical protein GPECTOR_4g583 [Gonium pectorale]|eukprot:KXZ54518.1 hypothetical protein GPECTOR_4g583 [Gonium pectorale]
MATSQKGVGIPVKLLHEAEGHVVTVELKTGEMYRGELFEAEDNMNVQLKDVTATGRDGRVSQLAHIFIRGSRVRFFIIPDMLKNAPMFKRIDPKFKNKNMALGVGGRGRAAAVRAAAKAKTGPSGRGRGLRLVLLAALCLPFVALGGMLHAVASGQPLTTSVYLVYGLLFRVPALGAVRLDEPPASAAVLNLVFLFGTFGFAILLGLISEEVKATVKALRAGGAPLDLHGHLLLLNFSPDATAVALLRQLAEDVSTPGSPLHGRPVVVLAAAAAASAAVAAAAGAGGGGGGGDVEGTMKRIVADALHAQALMCLALAAAHHPHPTRAPRAAPRDRSAGPSVWAAGPRGRHPAPTIVVQSPADAPAQLPSVLGAPGGGGGGGGPIANFRAIAAAEGARALVVEVCDRGIVDRLVAQTVLQPGVATVLASMSHQSLSSTKAAAPVAADGAHDDSRLDGARPSGPSSSAFASASVTAAAAAASEAPAADGGGVGPACGRSSSRTAGPVSRLRSVSPASGRGRSDADADASTGQEGHVEGSLEHLGRPGSGPQLAKASTGRRGFAAPPMLRLGGGSAVPFGEVRAAVEAAVAAAAPATANALHPSPQLEPPEQQRSLALLTNGSDEQQQPKQQQYQHPPAAAPCAAARRGSGPPAPPASHIIVISRTAAAVREVVAGLQEFAPAGSTITLLTHGSDKPPAAPSAGVQAPLPSHQADTPASAAGHNPPSPGCPGSTPVRAAGNPPPGPGVGSAAVALLPCRCASWPVGESDLVEAGLAHATAVLIARDGGLPPHQADAAALATVLQLHHTLTDPTRSPLRRAPAGPAAAAVTAAVAAAAAPRASADGATAAADGAAPLAVPVAEALSYAEVDGCPLDRTAAEAAPALHVVVCLHSTRTRATLRGFMGGLNVQPPFSLEALVAEEYRALLLAGVVRQPQSHSIMTDLLSDRPGAPEVYLVPPERLMAAAEPQRTAATERPATPPPYGQPAAPAKPAVPGPLASLAPARTPCAASASASATDSAADSVAAVVGWRDWSQWRFGDAAAVARAAGCTALGVLRGGNGGGGGDNAAGVDVGELGGVGSGLQLAPPLDWRLGLRRGDRLVVLAAGPI